MSAHMNLTYTNLGPHYLCKEHFKRTDTKLFNIIHKLGHDCLNSPSLNVVTGSWSGMHPTNFSDRLLCEAMLNTHIEVGESGIVHIVGAILVRFLLCGWGLVVVLRAVRDTQFLDPVCIPVGRRQWFYTNRWHINASYKNADLKWCYW